MRGNANGPKMNAAARYRALRARERREVQRDNATMQAHWCLTASLPGFAARGLQTVDGAWAGL